MSGWSGAAGALMTVTLLVGCGRTEEPSGRTASAPASKPPPSTKDQEPSPAASATPAARCVVPLAEPPPPTARPASECPLATEPTPLLPKASVRFLDAPSAPVVRVEVAKTPAHRERGLMFRTKMAHDAGMIFSWPSESQRSFWMRNTCLPLDMMFVAADGLILGILEQVPVLNEAPRSVACPAAHVLEVNAGFSRKHGIRPGQKLEIQAAQ